MEHVWHILTIFCLFIPSSKTYSQLEQLVQNGLEHITQELPL
jgi:hypothetical protein